MTNFFVYSLHDPISDQPFYVGKGSGTRPYDHLNESKRNTLNLRKYHKIQKIRRLGSEPEVRILVDNLSEECAFQYEGELIRQYGRKGYDADGILTNIAIDANPPNRTGYAHSEETKAKMRLAALGRKKSPEHCKNIGLSKQGEKHPFWGKPVDEFRRLKIQQSNLGKKRSPESRANIAKGHACNYRLIDPNGQEFYIDSIELKRMCKLKGFNKTSMLNSCRKATTYKGWTLIRIK